MGTIDGDTKSCAHDLSNSMNISQNDGIPGKKPDRSLGLNILVCSSTAPSLLQCCSNITPVWLQCGLMDLDAGTSLVPTQLLDQEPAVSPCSGP